MYTYTMKPSGLKLTADLEKNVYSLSWMRNAKLNPAECVIAQCGWSTGWWALEEITAISGWADWSGL